MRLRLQRLIQVACLASLAPLSPVGSAADGADHTGHASGQRITVARADYQVPDLSLIREDGRPVRLATEMNDGRVVVLNFIFTTCEGICPLMTQTFAEFQRKLGADGTRVHLMSVSIDPEQDTPARLREYAEQFGAGPGWDYYTGTEAASAAAQRAFGIYWGDKMSHTDVTFLRASPATGWRRIDGFATPDDLLRAYHELAPR